jgi:hypothetical protein
MAMRHPHTTARKVLGMLGMIVLSSLLYMPHASAMTYFDDFNNNTIDPAWWTVTATGESAIVASNGRVEVSQGATGFAAFGFVTPVVGDFVVTVDYLLINWPTNNQERLVLNAYGGPTNQLVIERISDRQYDPSPQRTGEVYLTDFTGQGILGTPTSDTSGTLKLERTGDTVRGSFWDVSGWHVIGTYVFANEGSVARTMGMGLFAGSTTTAGTKVALDNFMLSAPVPEPQTYALLVSGLALIGSRLRGRRVVRS